jgi:hypothetical protein
MPKVVEDYMYFTLTLFPFNITSNARFFGIHRTVVNNCQLRRANRYRLRESVSGSAVIQLTAID